MQTKVQRWGNSLAVRIPKSFASQSKLAPDCQVEMNIDGEIITLRAVKAEPKRYTLDELLDGMTPKQGHGEVSFGKPKGREVW